MAKIIKIFFIIVSALVILFFFWYYFSESKTTLNNFRQDQVSLKINNTLIPIEVVTTEKARARGLSYRENLPFDSGMLFVFETKQIRSFWMKEMNFPLDIVWLSDNSIVKINRDLPPGGSSPNISYSSDTPVNYVLELNGGFCQKNEFKVGDTFELLKFDN